MNYQLKNGESVFIRNPYVEDAEQIINVIKTADTETKFLARNPWEFRTTIEQEKKVIENILNDKVNKMWFVPEYNGKIVGQCSVELVRKNERYRHRATVAFILLKEYWGLGIGGKLMQECISWCEANHVEQIELDVLKMNERAISMYKSFGFEIVGVVPNAIKYSDGTYDDEYIMVKKLYKN
ncbi:MAG: GNAT family N-acetyltransferase [Clostridia bacterium]|nr:GNAT family N-acetyltransferase [Clostridia bacterium]